MPPSEMLKELLDKGAKLYSAGHTSASAAVYRKAIALAPRDPTVRLRYANAIWHGEQRADDALAEIRELLQDHPQAVVFVAEGLILNSLGRFSEAANAAEMALKADPDHSPAWLNLATAVQANRAEAFASDLEKALARPDLTDAMRRDMHFAMATFLKKLDRPDAAFEHTIKANDATPQEWSVEREAPLQHELKSVLSPDLMKRMRGAGHADGRMIFILGMPRSGTTLLERMLVAHPDISSAGETTTIGRMFLRLRQQCGDDRDVLARNLMSSNLQAMASAYLSDIEARLGRGRPYRIIDKMPANYLFLPVIRLMFPRAMIIHMQRHPLDTGLSCYEASFSFGLDYAARLDTLGIAYRMYADLMDCWHRLPGLRVHQVRYETLVQSPENVLRDILRSCSLYWDPACLQPAGEGMIKTASLEQARAAVTTSSVGRWRHYEDRLKPMIDAMGGMDWVQSRVPQNHDMLV